MTTNGLILIIGAVLLAIIHGVFLFLGSKSWKFFHSFMLFWVLVAAMFFTWYAAASLKTHLAWKEVHADLTKKVTEAKEEGRKLEFGPSLEVDTPSSDSLRGALAEEQRLLLDRGRKWPNCTITDAQGGSIDFTLPVTAPPADGGEPPVVGTEPPVAGAEPPAAGTDDESEPPPNVFEPGAILFVFREALTPDGWKVPVEYVGPFQVTAATETTVTVTVGYPRPDADQLNAINTRDAATTYVLYELPPRDGHMVFSDSPPDTEKRQANIEYLFGRTEEQRLRSLLMYGGLPEAEFRALNPPPSRLRIPVDTFNQMIAEYQRDGRLMRDLKAADPAFDPPPERVWFRVKFLRAHSMKVDADPGAPPLDAGSFDLLGQAIANNLQQGTPTDFEPGKEWQFDQFTANDLISQGICEKVDEYYVRPLHDYPNLFASLERRQEALDEAIALVQRETATVQEAKANKDKQIAYRTRERANLTADLDNFRKEQQTLTAHRQSLEQEWEAKKAAINEAYRLTRQLGEEIARLQKQWADEINSRVPAEAAGAQ